MFMHDSYLLGSFDEYNFKFLVADCSSAVSEVIKRQKLSNSSRELVGKAMIGSFFLAGMVKEETVVNIQLEGEGEIERVLAYSDRIGRMRGMAKHNSVQAEKKDITLGIGKGFFKVTRWGGEQKLQQSVTKMEKIPFESNLLNHIETSDQIVSFLSIHSKESGAETDIVRGLFLQALPYTPQEKIDRLLNRLNDMDMSVEDLFKGSLEETLSVMEEVLSAKSKIYDTGVPEFYCSCSADKIRTVILSIGREEAFSIIAEIGKIEISCEFCHETYTFDAEETKLLFM